MWYLLFLKVRSTKVFPIRDNIPSRSLPVLNITNILVCTVIYFKTMFMLEAYILKYGFIPSVFQFDAFGNLYRVITSMYLHGGVAHLVSNMLALYIFGDNVEDRLGKIGYIVLYIGSGVSGAALHYLTDPWSPIPAIGASACISGVIGAYVLMFPRARIETLVFLFFFVGRVYMPAFFYVFLWLLTQVQGALITFASGLSGGVGWFAHLGGFLFGFMYVLLTKPWYR